MKLKTKHYRFCKSDTNFLESRLTSVQKDAYGKAARFWGKKGKFTNRVLFDLVIGRLHASDVVRGLALNKSSCNTGKASCAVFHLFYSAAWKRKEKARKEEVMAKLKAR